MSLLAGASGFYQYWNSINYFNPLILIILASFMLYRILQFILIK